MDLYCVTIIDSSKMVEKGLEGVHTLFVEGKDIVDAKVQVTHDLLVEYGAHAFIFLQITKLTSDSLINTELLLKYSPDDL